MPFRKDLINRRILSLLQEHRILNTYEICRLLNGYGKREVNACYKGQGWAQNLNKNPQRKAPCHYHLNQCIAPNRVIHGRLRELEKRKYVKSHKLRFFDSWGNQTDIFRFWYLDEKEFTDKILKQTLIPYLQEDTSVSTGTPIQNK